MWKIQEILSLVTCALMTQLPSKKKRKETINISEKYGMKR